VAEQPVARRGRDAAVLAAGLALLFVLGLTSLRTKSAIYDEPVHFTAGYAAARFGEVRFNPDHPPLVGMMAAAPLLFSDVRFPADDPAWGMGRPYEVGRRFLYRWNDGDRLLARGRTVILGLAAGLAALVFFWTRALWGREAAAVALLLAVTSPDVLAHGQLVTTDLGATLFIFATVAAFQRVTERVTPARVALAGLALGAAFATKLSALILLPVLAVLAAVVALRGEPLPVGAGARTRARDKALVLAGVLAAMGAIGLAVVWSAYRFRYAASSDPHVEAAIPWDRLRPEEPLASLVDGLRASRVLPEGYLWGFVRFFEHQESRPSFLLGERSDHGFAAFFPVSFAVKTPVALLILLAIAVVLAARGRRRREDVFLWVPVLLYAAVSLTRGINIGHRHLLPLYPFLFVIAGRTAHWAASSTRRAPRVAVGALLAWHLGAALWIHPHYLAYFNELAGGPSRAYHLLVDSSLDWGQDLKGLKPYMQAHGIPRLKLSYFGTADPAYYGIEADLLPSYLALPRETVRAFRPGDVLAVSATNLAGVYLDPADRPMMERLRREQPVGSVGYSILIFRPSFAWPEAPAAR
jgi:dolichyl-phosphate-mannose-protein mannosyltransferase